MGKTESEKNKKVSSKHKRKKHRSSSSSSSSFSSFSSIDEETKRKLKKKFKKLKKKEKLKKKKKEKKALKKLAKSKFFERSEVKKNLTPCDVDMNLMEKSKILAPMTKEEWEKQQNTFKRVLDEETGRMRLVKGTGEIVEECVSRERHLAINRQATRGDGEFFQRKLMQHIK